MQLAAAAADGGVHDRAVRAIAVLTLDMHDWCSEGGTNARLYLATLTVADLLAYLKTTARARVELQVAVNELHVDLQARWRARTAA